MGQQALQEVLPSPDPGTVIPEHSSIEHRCDGQAAAEGSAASSGSTASSPSAVPVGSGKGLVLLYSLFSSAQLKHSAQFWDPQHRKALTYVSPVEGHQHEGCDQGLEHRMHDRREGKGGTFLQGGQSCSSERCPVGREEPIDSGQHRKSFLSVRGKCLWSW